VELEDEVFWEMFFVTPDNPADTNVGKTEFMATEFEESPVQNMFDESERWTRYSRGVDRDDTGEFKVPFELRCGKRCDEGTRRAVNCTEWLKIASRYDANQILTMNGNR
jgi:hypothetical protein